MRGPLPRLSGSAAPYAPFRRTRARWPRRGSERRIGAAPGSSVDGNQSSLSLRNRPEARVVAQVEVDPSSERAVLGEGSPAAPGRRVAVIEAVETDSAS